MSSVMRDARNNSPLLSQLRLVLAKSVWAACISTGHAAQDTVALSGDTASAANRWFGLHADMQLDGQTKLLVLEELRKNGFTDRSGLKLEGAVSPRQIAEILSAPDVIAVLLKKSAVSPTPSPVASPKPLPSSPYVPSPIEEQLQVVTKDREVLIRSRKYAAVRALKIHVWRIQQMKVHAGVRRWNLQKSITKWGGIVNWMGGKLLAEIMAGWLRAAVGRAIHRWHAARVSAGLPTALPRDDKLQARSRELGFRFLARMATFKGAKACAKCLRNWSCKGVHAKSHGKTLEVQHEFAEYTTRVGLRTMADVMRVWLLMAVRRCCRRWSARANQLHFHGIVRGLEDAKGQLARKLGLRVTGGMIHSWRVQSVGRQLHTWRKNVIDGQATDRQAKLLKRHKQLVNEKSSGNRKRLGIHIIAALIGCWDVRSVGGAARAWRLAFEQERRRCVGIRSLYGAMHNGRLQCMTRLCHRWRSAAHAANAVINRELALEQEHALVTNVYEVQLTRSKAELEALRGSASEEELNVAQLKARVAELEKQVAWKMSLEEGAKEIEAVEVGHEQAVAKLKSELAFTTEALESLRKDSSGSAQELSTLCGEVARLGSQLASAKKATEDANELMEARCLEQKEAFDEAQATHERDLAELRAAHDKKQCELQAAFDQEQASRARVEAELQVAVSDTRSKLEIQKAEAAAGSTILQASQARVTELEARLGEAQRTLGNAAEKASAGLSEHANSVSELATKLVATTTELESLKPKAASDAQRLASTQQRVCLLEEQLGESTEEHKALQGLHADCSTQVERLSKALSKVGDLEAELAAANGVRTKQAADLANLQAEFNSLKKSSNNLEGDLSSSQEKIELQSHLESATVTKLQAALAGANAELASLKSVSSASEISMSEAEGQIAKLTSELQRAQDREGVLVGEMKVAGLEYDASRSELAAELEAAKLRVHEAEEARFELDAELSSVRAESDTLRKTHKDELSSMQNTHGNEMSSVRAELDALRKTHDDSVTELESELISTQIKGTAFEKTHAGQLTNAQRSHEEAVSALHAQLDKETKALQGANHDLAGLRSDNARQANKLQGVDQRIDELSQELEGTKSKLKKAQDELRAEEEDNAMVVTDLKAELASNIAELESLRDESSTDALLLSETKAKAAELESRLGDTQDELDKSREHTKQVEEQHAAVLAELEGKLEGADAEVESVKDVCSAAVSEAESALAASVMELEALEDLQASVESKLAQSHTWVGELESQVSEYKRELAGLKGNASASEHERLAEKAAQDAELTETKEELQAAQKQLFANEKLLKDSRAKVLELDNLAVEIEQDCRQKSLRLIQDHSSQTKALKAEIAAATKELEHVKSAAEAESTKLAEARVESERLQGLLEEATLASKQAIDDANSTQSELSAEVSQLRSELAGANAELESFKNVSSEDACKLADLQGQVAELESSLRDSEHNLSEAKSHTEAQDAEHTAERGVLEASLWELKAEREALNETLSSTRAELVGFQESAAQLKSELGQEMVERKQTAILRMAGVVGQWQLQSVGRCKHRFTTALQAARSSESQCVLAQEDKKQKKEVAIRKFASIVGGWHERAMQRALWSSAVLNEAAQRQQYQRQVAAARLFALVIGTWQGQSTARCVFMWVTRLTAYQATARAAQFAAVHTKIVDDMSVRTESEKRQVGFRALSEEKQHMLTRKEAGLRLSGSILHKWRSQCAGRCVYSWAMNGASDKANLKLRKRKKAASKLEGQVEKLEGNLKKAEKQHMGQMVSIHEKMNAKMEEAIASKGREYGLRMFKSVLLSQGKLAVFRCFSQWSSAAI